MANADRVLQEAMRTIYRGLSQLKAARQSFIAQGLTSIWPATDPEYVHKDKDASTKAEQTDMGNFTLHALQALLNEGTGGGLTDAQAAAILNKYANK